MGNMIKRISPEKFEEVFSYVPRVAVDLIIKNKKNEILLAKRNIPPGVGKWHLPGSFPMLGETIGECIKRITRVELGFELKDAPKFLGIFENLDGDPRGHIIDLVYEIEVNSLGNLLPTEESMEIKFFRQLPVVDFRHDQILKKFSRD